MTATITHTLGRFVWRELFTRDVEAAKRFYGGLFGWTFEGREMGPDFVYTLVSTGGKQIAGIMDLADMPDGSGEHIPPHWAVYVSVADVDATVATAVAEGAKLVGECHDIPGVGRFAVLQDPQGAHFQLLHQFNGDPADGMPGTHEFCWESLMTSDPEQGVAFYQKVLGWGTKAIQGDRGPTPIFTRQGQDGTMDVASVGPVHPGQPPYWGTFVAVEAIDATLAKVADLGGQVIVPRTPLKDIGAFAVIQDTTDAMVMLFEPLPR